MGKVTAKDVQESLKKVEEKKDEIVVGKVKLKLEKDKGTGEWVVKWIENGKFNDDKSYYTDDKEDAIGTMKDMATRIKK